MDSAAHASNAHGQRVWIFSNLIIALLQRSFCLKCQDNLQMPWCHGLLKFFLILLWYIGFSLVSIININTVSKTMLKWYHFLYQPIIIDTWLVLKSYFFNTGFNFGGNTMLSPYWYCAILLWYQLLASYSYSTIIKIRKNCNIDTLPISQNW